MVDFVANNEHNQSNNTSFNHGSNSSHGPVFYVSNEYDRIVTANHEKKDKSVFFAHPVTSPASKGYHNVGFEKDFENSELKNGVQVEKWSTLLLRFKLIFLLNYCVSFKLYFKVVLYLHCCFFQHFN